MAAVQRVAHQPPQARHNYCQNANDLAREAVSCMGMFGALLLQTMNSRDMDGFGVY